MTWHSRIAFSCLLAGALGHAATVTGAVEVAAAGGSKAQLKLDSSGVAVWLEPERPQPQPAAPAPARMVQQNKQFVPHVLAIQVGAVVDFPNLDPMFHNAFSNIEGQPFDIGLYPPGTSRRVAFRRPGVVRIFCNIHQSMSAVIVVADTPYLAVSDKRGSFTMPDVPPGVYTLHLFHERAAQSTLDALARKIEVKENGTHVAAIRLATSGHIEMPHKNKYGHEYGPEPEDAVTYRKSQ